MKKVRVLFASLAIVFAGVAVYANSVNTLATVFYRGSTSTQGADCATDLGTSAICSGTSPSQCEVIFQGNTRYISKKINGGTCTVVPGTEL